MALVSICLSSDHQQKTDVLKPFFQGFLIVCLVVFGNHATPFICRFIVLFGIDSFFRGEGRVAREYSVFF